MSSSEVKSQSILSYIYLGAIQGAAAWSAYALTEFAFSSVLFRLVRPYATFTAWHWELTAQLICAYLLTGIVLGGLAGLAVSFFRKNAGVVVLEGAAVLTLMAAFILNLLAQPSWPSGKLLFLLFCACISAVVVAAMRWERLSERLGLLTSPWVVCGVLLGVGQGIGFLQLEDLGRQL
ncbi:MAG: hypothetical protein ABI822_32335, partial [Bryobacteraceae bacterium]